MQDPRFSPQSFKTKSSPSSGLWSLKYHLPKLYFLPKTDYIKVIRLYHFGLKFPFYLWTIKVLTVSPNVFWWSTSKYCMWILMSANCKAALSFLESILWEQDKKHKTSVWTLANHQCRANLWDLWSPRQGSTPGHATSTLGFSEGMCQFLQSLKSLGHIDLWPKKY